MSADRYKPARRLLTVYRLVAASGVRGTCASYVVERLADMGMRVALRTVQRDLQALLALPEFGVERTDDVARERAGMLEFFYYVDRTAVLHRQTLALMEAL